MAASSATVRDLRHLLRGLDVEPAARRPRSRSSRPIRAPTRRAAAACARCARSPSGCWRLAACVYVATLGRDGFWGFVNAGAEASMVGAIADWFAVTALFKHPLGLPIPHTALIPKRKDELGKGLEEFVGENFLQEDIIRERVAAATISARVGDWLGDPANARRVVDEVADVAVIALGKVRDEHVADLVSARPRAALPRGADLTAAGLDADGGAARRPAPRRGRPRGRRDAQLAARQPGDLHPGAGGAGTVVGAAELNDAVTSRVHVQAMAWLEDIRDDPHHRAREALDSMLGQPRPRPAQRRGDAAPDRGVQGAPARAPAGRRHGDLAVEGDAHGSPRLDPRPGGGRAAAPAGRAQRASRSSCARTPRCASGSTASPPTSRSSRSSATAPR